MYALFCVVSLTHTNTHFDRYAIGALVTGAVADWVGIPWSIGFTAILTALAGLLVFLFYEEVCN